MPTAGNSVEHRCISAMAAQRVVAAAAAEAADIGQPVTVVVVDDSGHRKAMLRMDGASIGSEQVATDKAYTAASFGMPTESLHAMTKDDAPLAVGALTGIERLVVFGGGIPIADSDGIIGAIGVSGGHYTQDMQIAKAGIVGLTGPSAE